ncbi:MAG: hypothetical protein J0L99_19450 [Chitinophagales bacterium]|nr:hypothetical protein [Chitinophagales bacterium]
MRHLLSVLLLLALLLPSAGSWLCLQQALKTQRRTVKYQLLQGLDRDQLQMFAFSKNDAARVLHWEHTREFEYQGQRYDVAEQRESSDSLYLLCLWDSRESQIHQQIKSLLSAALADAPLQHSAAGKQVLHFFKTLFLPPPPAPMVSLAEGPERQALLSGSRTLRPRCLPPPLAPPPD